MIATAVAALFDTGGDGLIEIFDYGDAGQSVVGQRQTRPQTVLSMCSSQNANFAVLPGCHTTSFSDNAFGANAVKLVSP
jgi:hypothetical protein